MKEETRGSIERMMDTNIKRERVDKVDWVERFVPVKSMEDLVLGYTIGELVVRAYMTITLLEDRDTTEKDMKDLGSMIKRRLPEIIGKINRELHR